MERVSKKEFSLRVAQVREGSYVSPSITQSASSPAAAAVASPKATRSRGADDSGKVPSVREYRGSNGITCAQPSRNVATTEAELSLPLGPRHKASENAHRTSHDITKHAEQGLLVGHGSIFSKELCSTSKGWSKGKF